MITIPLTIINDYDTLMCMANNTYNVIINIVIIRIFKTNISTITKTTHSTVNYNVKYK